MQSMLSRTPVSMKPLNESFYNQKLLMKNADIGSVDDHLQPNNTGNDKKKFGYFQ
jgi:hypothetical protein